VENKRFQSIRAARDFENLKENGRYYNPTRWLMVNYRFQDGKTVRCAWTISRQTAPSVIRNRLRRWGREFFRSWATAYDHGVDFNMIFKRQGPDFYRTLKHEEFNQVLAKVVRRFENA
jgi:ribonuclease P protein component